MQEPSEKIIKNARLSRRGFLFQYAIIISALVLAFYSRSLLEKGRVLGLFSNIFLIVALFLLAYAEIKIRYKRLIISNKRAVLEEGIFKKHSTTIRYTTITEIISRQSFMQRLLLYGTLSIKTAGGTKEHELTIEKIGNPQKIKRIMDHFMLAEHKV